MESVKGERLSTTIGNLMSGSDYYFKIQARNLRGYGPLSSVVTYASKNDVALSNRNSNGLWQREPTSKVSGGGVQIGQLIA